MARECWRETRAAAAACGEWLRLALVAEPLLSAPGAARPLPPAQPQPQLQQLPPHLQRAPAAESRAPCALAAGPGGTAIAGSLLDLHPACFPALSSLRQPGLGRAWGGRDRIGGGTPGWGLRRGKVRVGDSGKNAHPLALEPASALRLGHPSEEAARSCRGVGDGARFSEVSETRLCEIKGGKVHFPPRKQRAF